MFFETKINMAELEKYEELDQDEELDEIKDVSDVSYDDLELIEMIKLYPGLWNNGLKIYSKVEDKNLTWASIGKNLTTPLSGKLFKRKFLFQNY